MKPTLITFDSDRRAIDCTNAVTPEQFFSSKETGDLVLVEPVFIDFGQAGNVELGFPFLCLSAAPRYRNMAIFLTYSGINAMQFKGYIQDIVDALKGYYPFVRVLTVPFVTCGVPLLGTTLAILAGDTKWGPVASNTPVMPSEYFPGMLAHVPRNKPNFPIGVSSRFLGAVRSDLNLLPALQAWGGRTLMVEYKKDKTTELRRMLPEHVGKLFGVKPCQYTDELVQCLPGGVVEAFVKGLPTQASGS